MNIWLIIMIFAIIIFIIIPSFKSRTMPVKKLIIMPAIFGYLSYQAVASSFLVNNKSILIITIAIILGISIGFLIRKPTPITADKTKHLISLPGSYVNLVIFILLFTVHYIIGYLKAVHPAFFHQQTIHEQGLLFILVCVSSISLGSSACLYYKYAKYPTADNNS